MPRSKYWERKARNVCVRCEAPAKRKDGGGFGIHCVDCARKAADTERGRQKNNPKTKARLRDRIDRAKQRAAIGLTNGNQYQTCTHHRPATHILDCLGIPHSCAWEIRDFPFGINSSIGAKLEPKFYSILPKWKHLVEHLGVYEGPY